MSLGKMELHQISTRSRLCEIPSPYYQKVGWGFLVLTGYYQRFIMNFSKATHLLLWLTSPKVPFKWTPQCQDAIEQLKKDLPLSMIMAISDINQPLAFHLEAFIQGLVMVLYNW